MIRRGLLSDVSVIYGCVQHDDEVHVSILALSYDQNAADIDFDVIVDENNTFAVYIAVGDIAN